MLVQRIVPGLCASAALVLASAPAAPAAWTVRPADQGRAAWLAGVATLPGGHSATLLDERAGGHRLVLRRPDHAPLTLARSAHSPEAELGADAHGHLAVVWTVIPDGARFRRAFVWTGGTVQALTDGTRHAFADLAVGASGDLAVAVTDGTTAAGASRAWVRRGSFRTGLRSAREEIGVRAPFPGSLVVGPTAAVAVGGELGAGGGEVSVAPRRDAPFGAVATLPPVTAPAGRQAISQGLTVAFGPTGEVITAASTLTCTIGAGDLAGECGRLTGSTVRLWRWPAGASGPGGAATVAAPAFAQQPVLATSGGATWLAWLEGATNRPQRLAAARVGASGLGRTRRLSLAPDERAVPLALSVATAPHGALRFYLPAPGRPTSALDTVTLSAGGRFGSRETVVRGPRYGGANTVVIPSVPTGVVRDLVGWTSYEGRPAPWIAVP